jgi:hypothetical protein
VAFVLVIGWAEGVGEEAEAAKEEIECRDDDGAEREGDCAVGEVGSRIREEEGWEDVSPDEPCEAGGVEKGDKGSASDAREDYRKGAIGKTISMGRGSFEKTDEAARLPVGEAEIPAAAFSRRWTFWGDDCQLSHSGNSVRKMLRAVVARSGCA